MLVPRQQYSRELKIACMRELDSGKSMAEIARQYQLSPKRLETWKAEWRAKGELAFPGKGARPQPQLDTEHIAKLERKIGQQAMEIDFFTGARRISRTFLSPFVDSPNEFPLSHNHSSLRRRTDDKSQALRLEGSLHEDQVIGDY